jgi:diadenosine tetraphosphatase ApaH/serine/threonine PP2A family protein phosphatase
MYILVGGRNNNAEQSLPVSLYDTKLHTWKDLVSLPRFRQTVWAHNNKIYAFGGFEHTELTISVGKLVELDLGEELKSILYPPEEHKEPPKPKHESETMFQLSPFVHIASSFSLHIPKEVQQVISTVPISNLDEEGRKLVPSNPIFFINDSIRNGKQVLAQSVILRLLKPKDWNKTNIETDFPIKPEFILQLIEECLTIVKEQPIVCKAKVPVKIFGDIHGQYNDLMKFFDLWRGPTDIPSGGDIESFDYVFLGDYVDHGCYGLEVVCLLMALKIKYPLQIHLLRGNHEDKFINNISGFSEECAERLREDISDPSSVFQTINRFFTWLPLAAVINDKVICMHGGVGSSLNSIEDIRKLKRPLEVVHEVSTLEQQMLIDILWSDPTGSDEELGISQNFIRDPKGLGSIYNFGPDRVEQFLKQSNLQLMIRGHECVMDGIERFAKGKLITVFSATDYCNKHKNAGAVLFIQKDLKVVPKLIYPIDLITQSTWMTNITPPTSMRGNKTGSSFT